MNEEQELRQSLGDFLRVPHRGLSFTPDPLLWRMERPKRHFVTRYGLCGEFRWRYWLRWP